MPALLSADVAGRNRAMAAVKNQRFGAGRGRVDAAVDDDVSVGALAQIVDVHARPWPAAQAVEPIDLPQLPYFCIYVRLMIDGAPSRPFRAATRLGRTLIHFGHVHAAPIIQDLQKSVSHGFNKGA